MSDQPEFPIMVQFVATEMCEIELYAEDFDGPVTPTSVREKAIEIFEMPDFTGRTGANYDVQFDTQDLVP